MPENIPDPEREAILQALHKLEQRIARLETRSGLSAEGLDPARADDGYLRVHAAAGSDDAELEQSIGEFGLAWTGSIAFLLGIVFLMTYSINQGHSLVSALIGYCAAAGLYVLARAWRKGFPYLAHILVSASLLLAFYTTVRLHYFSAAPLIENRLIAFVLLLLVVSLQLTLALLERSQVFTALVVLLGLTSALLSDNSSLMLPLVALHAALAVYLASRFQWWRLLNLTIILVYVTHVIWLLDNPIAGHPLRAVASDQYSLVYLFVCAAIFAWPTFSYGSEALTHAARVGVVILNCLGFPAVVALATMALFPRSFAVVSLWTCGLLLACAVVQWWKTHLQLAPAAYACFGYMALSAAIYGFAKAPEAFLWLALQSFLVVSMALWFRSRALVVVNAVIFLSILVVYWISSPLSNVVNFTFAAVALLSARVMNWQKERLTLQTEGLRNVYLAITFVMVLDSLYHAVPGSYVALSWTVTAVAYFLLSLLLKNVKYRWMSIFTLLATILYLLLVDLAHLEPKFRVAAFLFLGLMTVAISLFYARLKRPARRDGS